MGVQRFHVVNLGCKVNRVEADALSASLMAGGSVSVCESEADLIVVNTCTVTGEADKKARKAVRHALSSNARARVVVTGCAAAIDAAAFEEIDPRVEVILKGQLVEALAGRASTTDLRYGAGFRTRVSIKVQDGCDHACTYCIVHVARGKAVSKPFDEAVREARAYMERGVKEVVLTGIDLASYRDGAFTLAALCEALLEEADKACAAGENPARLRVSSIEPQTLDEEFVELVAQSGGRVCRHLHLPLQSGSSRVLAEMARPYSAEYYADLVRHLRSSIPELSLTTDIICGFPGETNADFEETLQLAERCGFSKIHVFPYSKRKGTPAAMRDDQVDPRVKSERAAELRAVSARLRQRDFESRIGHRELAIVEDDIALTESYHELAIPEGAMPGQLVTVKFDKNPSGMP